MPYSTRSCRTLCCSTWGCFAFMTQVLYCTISQRHALFLSHAFLTLGHWRTLLCGMRLGDRAGCATPAGARPALSLCHTLVCPAHCWRPFQLYTRCPVHIFVVGSGRGRTHRTRDSVRVSMLTAAGGYSAAPVMPDREARKGVQSNLSAQGLQLVVCSRWPTWHHVLPNKANNRRSH